MTSTRLVVLMATVTFLAGCGTRIIPPRTDHIDYQASDQFAGRPTDGRHNDAESGLYMGPDGTVVRVTNADLALRADYRRLSAEEVAAAYERGVRDTMEEFAGRMDGRAGFVWEPPLVEIVVVPAGIVNGAFYPERTQTVIVSPGRWVEHNNVMLPERRGS